MTKKYPFFNGFFIFNVLKLINSRIIAAIESRTSSPLRICRDDEMEANVKGIYPIGEGAGYAGGITTAAMDGIKVSEIIQKKYFPCYFSK